MGRIYEGDTGVEVLIDCKEPLAPLTGLKIFVLRPDQQEVEWIPSIAETTKMKYITTPTDFDIPGTYRLQPYAEQDPWAGRGLTAVIVVYPKFDVE